MMTVMNQRIESSRSRDTSYTTERVYAQGTINIYITNHARSIRANAERAEVKDKKRDGGIPHCVEGGLFILIKGGCSPVRGRAKREKNGV